MFEQQLLSIVNKKDVRTALIEIKKNIKANEAVLKSTKGYSKELFADLLNNEDPKVRKNAALIMGALKEDGFRESLFERYLAENTLFVKSAYLEALMNFDYQIFSDVLTARMEELSKGQHEENELKHIAEELKVLRKMFSVDDKHKRHVFAGTKGPVRIVMTVKKDLIPMVLEKASHINGFTDVKSVFCGVAATITDFAVVKKFRLFKELLLPLNGMGVMTKAEIPQKLIEGNLLKLLEQLHKEEDGPFYFRITSKELDVAKLGAKLEAASGGRLVNSPSDYEVEIKLITGKEDKVIAFLKLHTFGDHRFNYRTRHVAASIHPSDAALIAELAKDYMKKGATVMDPFCGVGTMLVERHKNVPARHMYGTDTFAEAIDGGRNNANMARVDINFINRDYFDFTLDHEVDEIITNVPVFREREEADSFYGRFFKRTETILKKGGIIIMYSDEKNIIKKHMRLNENYKLLREFVFNEKEERYVFVLTNS